MEASTARRLAHGMWFGTLAIWLGALILELATSPSDAIPVALLGLPIATYGSVGALVARRTPRNPIGWLFSAVGLAIAIWLFGLAYAAIGLDAGAGVGDLPGAAVAAWAGVVSLIGVLPIALPLFLLYFPDGRLPSRRWRPVLWAVGLGGVLLVVGTIGHSWVFDPIFLFPPGWTRHVPGIEQAYVAGSSSSIATAFAGLLALILRFRGSSAEQRQPLRLLVVDDRRHGDRHDRARDRDRARVARGGMVMARDRARRSSSTASGSWSGSRSPRRPRCSRSACTTSAS